MRRKVESPYLRGEATKARILTEAVRLFGTKGFDRVTTREIAHAASVPQASLRYYFGSKDGLYVACLEQIQTQLFTQMEPALNAADALLDQPDAGIDSIIDCFCALQDAIINSLIDSNDDGSAALMLIRHDLPSEGGAGALAGDETAIRRIASTFTELMIRISGDRLDRASASRVTGIINGQITNIYLRRNRLRDEGWSLSDERVAWIKKMIRLNTTAILAAHQNTAAIP